MQHVVKFTFLIFYLNIKSILTLFENKKIKHLKRKPEAPCIHFELHFTLNHLLKTKGGENLHDLFNIDADSVCEPVCEQKQLWRSLAFKDAEYECL